MLITYEELRDNVLDRAEEEIGVATSEFGPLAREFLDRAYFELLNRRIWLFAKSPRPLVIPLQKPIESLSVTWAQGAYLATLSADPGRDLTDWIARVGSSDWEYRIVGHPSPTQVMFDVPGPDQDAWPSGWTAQPVFLFKHEYDLFEITGPSPVPTAALVAATPGSIPAGTYDYTCTAVGRMGETARSAASNQVTITDPSAAGQIDVTVPAAPYPNVRGRFIYRRKTTEIEWYAVGAVYGGVGTAIFRDNIPAASPRPPSVVNTTAVVRQIADIWPRDETWALVHMSQSDLRARFSDPIEDEDPPRAYTRIGQNRIRLSSYSRSSNVLEVDYTTLAPPLSGSIEWEIQVPRQWRWILADYALGLLLEQKHSDRAKFWIDRFEANVSLMYAEDELARQGYDGLRQGRRREPGR